MLSRKRNWRALGIGAFVVLLVAFSAMLLVDGIRPSTETGLPALVVLEAAAPATGLLQKTLDGLKRTWERYLFLVGLEEENRRLKKEQDRLLAEASRYREAALEAERLRGLLQLRAAIEHSGIAARVIQRNMTIFFKTLLIDKGTADGVEKGDAVIAEAGIIGRVLEASWHSAKVLLLVDENSSIDCLIQRTRIQGILQGGGRAGCMMKYVAKPLDVQAGDTVVTAGLAGRFPKGLYLGRVTDVSKAGEGLFQRIDVAPRTDLHRIEEVLVVQARRESPP